MSLRNIHPDPDDTSTPAARLNLLLSCGVDWRTVDAIEQLPRLLDPMGIRSMTARCGREAAELIQDNDIHIAVVDLQMPLDSQQTDQSAGGARILQMLSRLEHPPPTVVLRRRIPTPREHQRSLSAALQGGAFAVMDQQPRLETMLEVMRRILHRHYADAWPLPGAPPDTEPVS